MAEAMRLCLTVVVLAIFASTSLVHALTQLNCTTPQLILWEQNDCIGEGSKGPYFDKQFCPGECWSRRSASTDYTCQTGQGMTIKSHSDVQCHGPYRSDWVATETCINFYKASMAITCAPDVDVAPPVSHDPPSYSNFTWHPGYQCPPQGCAWNIPSMTTFDNKNCRGEEYYTNQLFAGTTVDSCSWLGIANVNIKLACDHGLLYIYGYTAGCHNRHFTVETWPLNVCLNDEDSSSSIMFHCGAGAHVQNVNASQTVSRNHHTQQSTTAKSRHSMLESSRFLSKYPTNILRELKGSTTFKQP